MPHLRRICVEVLYVNPVAMGINVRVDSGASLDVLDLFSPYSYYDLGRHLKGQSREIKFFIFCLNIQENSIKNLNLIYRKILLIFLRKVLS